MRKLISIVLPVFNEEQNLPILLDQLQIVAGCLSEYDFEIICVNDGSLDGSMSILSDYSKKSELFRAIDLSRNFGVQNAVTAGIDSSRGDAIITMDADLQHPVHVLRDLIEEWEKGFEIVIGRREGSHRNLTARFYFWALSKLSDIQLDSQTSDLRLLDKKVAEELRRFPERQRFMRGLVQWVGFKKKEVPYRVRDRYKGATGFSLGALLRLAAAGFTSFSITPLRAALFLGGIILGGSFLSLIYMSVMVTYVSPEYFRPIAFVAVFNALLSGLILVCLGLVANYVGFVHKEVIGRPLYIVRQKINFLEENE